MPAPTANLVPGTQLSTTWEICFHPSVGALIGTDPQPGGGGGGGYREKAGVTQIHGATAEGLGWITAKVGRVLGQGWLHRHVTWAVTQGPGLRKAHVQFNALLMS